MSAFGLLHMLSKGCCENTFVCNGCLHAVYHQPITQSSVFQPGFREWLTRLPSKQTEIAWDEIGNQFYVVVAM